jgi:hypothetical protein
MCQSFRHLCFEVQSRPSPQNKLQGHFVARAKNGVGFARPISLFAIPSSHSTRLPAPSLAQRNLERRSFCFVMFLRAMSNIRHLRQIKTSKQTGQKATWKNPNLLTLMIAPVDADGRSCANLPHVVRSRGGGPGSDD